MQLNTEHTEFTESGNAMKPEPDQNVLDSSHTGPWSELTHRVIGCAMEVHRALGPGLLERLYEEALCIEFAAAGLRYERQVCFRVPYKGVLLSEQRLDLVVERAAVLELKSVQTVQDVHLAQLVSYLRATGLPVGLVLNFNVMRLRDGVFRRLNTPDKSVVRASALPSL